MCRVRSVLRGRRVAVGVLFLAALAGGVLVVRSGWRLRDLGGSPRPDGVAATDDVKCGPRSLWTAGMRLGVPLALSQVLAMPIHPVEGASLGELRAAATEFGLQARTARVSFDELARHQGTAVLFVHGNHFVAADPREQNPQATEPMIRVYDTGKLASWWSRAEVEAAWRGEALLLENPPAESATGPRVAWETCWSDLGVVTESDLAKFTFPLRNTGTAPLTVEIAHVGCACTRADLSRKEVPPGETAVLTATVDLSTKRGALNETVTIRTNDPGRGLAQLVLGVGTANNFASARAVHWGSLRPGQSTSHRVALFDPGEGRLEVRSVEWTPGAGAGSVTCQTQVERVKGGPIQGTEPSFSMTAEPGDYVITARLTIPEDASPGRLSGDLWVSTNLRGKWARFSVAIEGQVLADVEAAPAALLFSGSRTLAQSATVRLKSVTGKPLTLDKVVARGVSLTLGPAKQTGNGAVEFVAELPAASTGDPEGSVVCHLASGQTIQIPVVVVQAP